MGDEPVPEASFSRHPLGLPAGSVRATLALMIAGLFWLLMALPDTFPADEHVPLFLYLLLALIMLFFGAHGNTIGKHVSGHSPLYLPRGVLRAFLILGTAALLGWLFYAHPDRTWNRLTPDKNQLEQWPALLLAMFGGVTVGYVVRKGPWRKSPGFQDLLASVSLLAMIGLIVETIWIVFVNPSLENRRDPFVLEAVLTAIVSFYYGARS
jgi:hypothetical protein